MACTIDRFSICRHAAIIGLGHLAHFLADGEIAYAHLAQGAVHVGKELIGEGLRQLLMVFFAQQPVQHKKQVQHDHLKSAVNRIRHAPFSIKPVLPRRGHNCAIEGFNRSGLAAQQALENHALARRNRIGQKAAMKSNSSFTGAVDKLNRRSLWLAGVLSLASAGLVAGCSPEINHRGYYAKPGTLSQIGEGMAKSEVEAIMGSPSTTASINYQGDSFYYITSVTQGRAFLDPAEIKREVIAIRFDQNDQVQSVAQYGLEDGRIIDLNTRKTPVAGQEFSILRELFHTGVKTPSGNMLNRKL
jgi:outer membrane protein assembly factor BamE (lipoprotein component of BamABCDE complex)